MGFQPTDTDETSTIYLGSHRHPGGVRAKRQKRAPEKYAGTHTGEIQAIKDPFPSPTADVALVLSIVGIIVGWVVAGVPSWIAIWFAVKALRDNTHSARVRAMALWAITLGSIGATMGVIVVLAMATYHPK